MSSAPLLPNQREGSTCITAQVDHQCGSLALFVDAHIIQDMKAAEGRAHCIARRIFQGMSIVAGVTGRLPFIEMNLQLGGDNKVYGGFLAYGTCASFGYLVSYSLLEIVDSQMRPLTKEEKVLTESRMNSTLKKTFLLGSTILGFATQIPFAYIAYKYNDPSDINPGGLVMPIMVLAIDSWVSTYSGYMGLRTLRERQGLNVYEKELAKVRGKMHTLIETNRQLLTVIGKEARLDIVGAYNRIKFLDNSPKRVADLYTLFTNRFSDQTLEPSCCAKSINHVVKAYGYLCAACNIGTLGYIAWLGTNELTDNIGADITVTSLYVGTALYLNLTAIPQTAVTLFNLFKDLFTCNYQPTLSDQLTPKLSFALKALGLATAALSYGPAIKLSKDYYRSEEGLEVFMEITLTCATTFLVSMAILAITDQLLEYKVEKTGTDEEKSLVELNKKMRIFSSTLASSPLLEIAHFLRVIPRDAAERLFENTEISLSNLDTYLAENVATSESSLLQA